MMLPTIDLALRAGATALLLLLALLLLRDFNRAIGGRLAAAFALGSAAFAVSSAATAATWPIGWRAPLIAVSTGNVVVFWLFTRTLFDDAFRVRRWHLALWLSVALLSVVNCVLIGPAHTGAGHWPGVALTVIALGFIVLAVVQSVVSWSADLVEGRRRLRTFIVGAAALYGGVHTVMQFLLDGEEPPLLVSTVNAGVLAAIVAVVVWAMTRAAGDEVFPPMPVVETLADTLVDPLGGPSVVDQRLIDALNRLMASERVYRHEGVTIGTLASRLNVPEYRLRRVINQRLGYRNFNVFLNNYRIAEAKAALADPAQAEVPVTTIALDAGFQSLGPFNRAFKTETGLTPTEFRRARIPAI